MMIAGAGWVGSDAYGAVRKQIQKESTNGLFESLKTEGVFSERVKNFGRFDTQTRGAFCAAALALHDANFSEDWKKTGLIGTGSEESTLANQMFFADYADYGRKLARANLFIYTLPTSPLAEIAIHFKLNGPLFYTSADLLCTASGLLTDGEASCVLALWSEKGFTAALLLNSEKGDCLEKFQPLETPNQLIHSLQDHFSSQRSKGSGEFL